MVAGLNYRRSPPFDSLAGWWCKDKPGWDTPYTWPNQLTEVDIVGSGSMLVNTSVFESLPAPWFGYSYNPEAPDEFPGVDIWFCRLCNGNASRLWVDPTMTSPHLADAQVDRAMFYTHLKRVGGVATRSWQGSTTSQVATRTERDKIGEAVD